MEKFEQPKGQFTPSEDEQFLRDNAAACLERAMEQKIIPEGTAQLLEGGETSIVYKVSAESGERVVKMARTTEMLQSEIAFLDTWRAHGVRTPQVEDFQVPREGIPLAMAVLEYINGQSLDRVMGSENLISSGTARQLGHLQAKMHKAQADGYGLASDSKMIRGQYDSFREEMMHRVLLPLERHATSGEITADELAKAHVAADILVQQTEQAGFRPSLTHNDFRPYNVLLENTGELVVIDPDARITHPYLCLSLTLLKPLMHGRVNEAKEILKGYTEVSPVNEDQLRAAMILKGFEKVQAWTRPSKQERAIKLRQWLQKTVL